jgi:hypothetical protein
MFRFRYDEIYVRGCGFSKGLEVRASDERLAVTRRLLSHAQCYRSSTMRTFGIGNNLRSASFIFLTIS